MYGFELVPFLRFCVQISAVIAASASLWGMFFAFKAKREKDAEIKWKWYKLAKGTLVIFGAAVSVFLAGWWALAIFVFPLGVVAHEGVVHSLDFPRQYVQNGFNVNVFWVSVLSALYALAAIVYLAKGRSFEFFKKYSLPFFGANFVLLSVIISLSLFSGKLGMEQLVLSLHNWHSIMTLGTVIIVDSMYLYTINRQELKKVLYPIYPLMSVSIWAGLGLDFITSLLVVGGGFPDTTQFIFNQMVVVVLILNGAMLSVRINDKLIELVRGDKILSMGKKWTTIIQVSGSISIISWFTITFLDFFDFTFSLWQFFAVYIFAIMCAAMVNFLIERAFVKFAT